MMHEQISVTRQREIALRDVCAGLASDLRKIDPASYFLFFELGELPAVYDEVNRFIDRHFEKGRMGFACTGETKIGWNAIPELSVDLEFSGEDILVFFRLSVLSHSHEVELHHISFQHNAGDPEKNTCALTTALARARRS